MQFGPTAITLFTMCIYELKIWNKTKWTSLVLDLNSIRKLNKEVVLPVKINLNVFVNTSSA